MMTAEEMETLIEIYCGEPRDLRDILQEHLAYKAHIYGARNDLMRQAHTEVFGYDVG